MQIGGEVENYLLFLVIITIYQKLVELINHERFHARWDSKRDKSDSFRFWAHFGCRPPAGSRGPAIEDRSSFRCQRLRPPARPPRPVSNDNSRFMSAVTLLFSFSLAGPLARSPLPRNYRRIYKERRIYKPAKSGLSCSPMPLRRALKSLESTEKAGREGAQPECSERNGRDYFEQDTKSQLRHSWPSRDRFFFQINGNVIGRLLRGFLTRVYFV